MHSSDMRKRLVGLVFAAASLVPVHALGVTPGSECASYCMDAPDSSADTTTKAEDIVCSNTDFWSTATGTKYRNCVDCLQNSTTSNGAETDTEYYLYNVRYALDVCLYSSPSADAAKTASSSKCAASSCQPLKAALESGMTGASNETQYDYCTANNSAFSKYLQSCQTCLQSETNLTYLSNFLTALDAGCTQQPPAGTTLGLSSTLFTSSAVAIVAPNWNKAATSSSSSSSSSDSSSSTNSHNLAIGIAVGCAVFFALAIALFYWLWRTRHGSGVRRISFLPSTPGTGGLLSAQYYPGGPTSGGGGGGGYTPFFTTDYKQAMQEQRNQGLYETIKTQHVIVPARPQYDVTSAGMPMSSVLWGRDTPVVIRKQIEETQNYLQQQQQMLAAAGSDYLNSTSTSNANVDHVYHMGQRLDEMPTHPAFMPRAFTRPSRNPVALAAGAAGGDDYDPTAPPHTVKSNKPDAYAAQHYLAGLKDTSHIDLASLLPPPSPVHKPELSRPAVMPQHKLTSSESDSLNDEASISLRSRSISPSTIPLLRQPGPPKRRASKRNVPPPIDITKTKAKATRVDEPQTNQP